MIGNGTSETYNPFIVWTPIDTVHVAAVFDPMVRPAPYYGRENGLITNWSSDKDPTVSELTLRDGVTWQEGKPLMPDDLICTMRTFAAPTSWGGNAVATERLNDLRKVGKNTVSLPLSPVAGVFSQP